MTWFFLGKLGNFVKLVLERTASVWLLAGLGAATAAEWCGGGKSAAGSGGDDGEGKIHWWFSSYQFQLASRLRAKGTAGSATLCSGSAQPRAPWQHQQPDVHIPTFFNLFR